MKTFKDILVEQQMIEEDWKQFTAAAALGGALIGGTQTLDKIQRAESPEIAAMMKDRTKIEMQLKKNPTEELKKQLKDIDMKILDATKEKIKKAV